MNTISGVLQLHQPCVQTVFRQLLPLLRQHRIGRNMQSFYAQHKYLFGSFTKSSHFGRPATDVMCSLKKPFILQKTPVVTGKLVCQDYQRGITSDSKTTAVTIWEDLKHMRSSPVPALVLGFSGLIPFVAAPAYMVYTQAFSSHMVFAQTAYGACILSFLGGVRWGFVIPEESQCPGDWINFGYSVTPSLVAWTALMLPQPTSILLVILGIAGSAYFDTTVRGYPSWFKGLRFTLSFGAILALWTAFLCQYMLEAPADKQEAPKEDRKN